MSHTAQHEELLQRILVEDLAADAPEVRATLNGCPVCANELERLDALSARLRGAAKLERGVLEEAVATADLADEQLVRHSLVRALSARESSRPPTVGRRRFGIFALAAGLLVLGALAAARYLATERQQPQEILLGGGDIECVAPKGEVERFGSFSWNYELPAGCSFEVRISALEDGKKGVDLQKIPGLLEPRWNPTPEEEQALPPAIYWEVFVIDETTGIELESGFAPARRR